ncbi:MAG TPA: L-seryl-tRNA(Sec) selenium transferase, partial [Pyrinomonadaceae bacterium]|nr:L-seryl-tRNA(Sec) selenium transferase [Pyrinomonadaceae bacterium]
RLAALARAVTDELRAELRTARNNGDSRHGESEEDAPATRDALLREAKRKLKESAEREGATRLRRVINASGVILHTNLGRAPLGESARRRIAEAAAGYCTLEYDVERGERGRRGARAESLLAELTRAEAALVVNNCAAAALLVLTALARGGEALVSRGELVEIGGDFRVPDVMTQSGTRLVEVGTTNRTRLADYESHLSEHTRLVMRVHPSNYRIVGFTSAPSRQELATFARLAGLPFYEDAGSGALLDFAPYGLTDEPIISQAVADGADVISFSGDKLLGGPQAGLIVGRGELIDRLRRAPLYRALRTDKLTLAALEATLEEYAAGRAFAAIPAVRMISASEDELAARARSFLDALREQGTLGLTGELLAGESAVGGGAAPITRLRTTLIVLNHESLAAPQLLAALRRGDPPVIARVADDRVLLDLRTVAEGEEERQLLAAVVETTRRPPARNLFAAEGQV